MNRRVDFNGAVGLVVAVAEAHDQDRSPGLLSRAYPSLPPPGDSLSSSVTADMRQMFAVVVLPQQDFRENDKLSLHQDPDPLASVQ